MTYNEFKEQIYAGKVTTVSKENENTLVFIAKNENGEPRIYKTGIWVWPDEELNKALTGLGSYFCIPVSHRTQSLCQFLSDVDYAHFDVYAIGVIMSKFMSKRMGGNAMTFGKSNAKIYAENETGKTFADVAGEEEAKEALKRDRGFPSQSTKVCRHRCNSAKRRFVRRTSRYWKNSACKGSGRRSACAVFLHFRFGILEMFVGMGAAKVRDLFKQANEKAPCIVFIDRSIRLAKSVTEQEA